MNRFAAVLTISACLTICAVTHAAGNGRIGLFADVDHSISEIWYGGEITQFDMYIYCLPGDSGMMCAEFSVLYPGNAIASTPMGNPGLSVTLGNLESGMSACFLECRTDWVWTHKQTILLMDDSPSTIEIADHSGSGVYQFANCSEGFPTEAILYDNPLFLNSTFTGDEQPPSIVSASCPDQNHIIVDFDEPLLPSSALAPENYTVYSYYDYDTYHRYPFYVDVVPASLTNDDMTVTLVTQTLLMHDHPYYVGVNGIEDYNGNVLEQGVVSVLGRDTYQPEFSVCEVAPDRMSITVCFSEWVVWWIADDIGNYDFVPDLSVAEAIPQDNHEDVVIVFDEPFTAGVTYRLKIRNVSDPAGNVVSWDDFDSFGVPDIYPPEIFQVSPVTLTVLSVQFTELVDMDTALEPANYEVLEKGNPHKIVQVLNVGHDVTDDWVYLYLERALVASNEHVLSVIDVCDQLGNCIGSEDGLPLTVVFTYDPEVSTMLQCFSADLSDDGIDIRWTLSSTVPADRFIISRSEDGDTRFKPIEHPAIENSGTDYRFTDVDLIPGRDYRYRLVCLSDEGEKLLFETETIETAPPAYQLFQNHPNPFNPSTEISYSLPEAAHVSIGIFDVSGRCITVLVNGRKRAGMHKATWNGTDQGGSVVASGIYFYRIKAGKWTTARKMILMR